jgi:surfeit locus 1 family protein
VIEAPASRRFVVFGGGLLVTVLVPLFVSLGQWQWNKASLKEGRQSTLDLRAAEPAMQLPPVPVSAEEMRYRKVVVRGVFEPQRQILIDNRIHRERAGYHIVTPLRIEGSDLRVLVNRGWVPADHDRKILPIVDTPTGVIDLQATAVPPGTRFFTLGKEAAAIGWQPVWQNLDLARYRQAVDFPLQPVILQLDPDSAAGFVRDWPRLDERIERHVGYAWQWFGFAAATVCIWLFYLLRPLFRRQAPANAGVSDHPGSTQ